MRKYAFLLLLHCCMACLFTYGQDIAVLTANDQQRDEASRKESVYAPSSNEIESIWSRGKKLLYQQNIQLGANISFLAQRAAPSGKQTAIQAVYNPYLNWKVFENETWGSGQVDANYTFTRYWGTQATTLQRRTHLAGRINNFEDNQENFAQLSYTHTLPGAWNFLSVTLGQYTIDNFDGTQYLDDQQLYLIHHSLSQNESALYPDSSLGAYVQAKTSLFTAAVGYQDANNLSGAQVRVKDAFAGQYTTFGAFIWTPTWELGPAQYGFVYYYQPSIEKQPGSGHGWSFNIQQNIGEKWALFARANGATEGVIAVKQSYVLGGALLNPLDRHQNDAILVAVGHNRLSRQGLENPQEMRPCETVLEAQWIWGIGKLITITPDLQIIPRAGLSRNHHIVTVLGLRTAILL